MRRASRASPASSFYGGEATASGRGGYRDGGGAAPPPAKRQRLEEAAKLEAQRCADSLSVNITLDIVSHTDMCGEPPPSVALLTAVATTPRRRLPPTPRGGRKAAGLARCTEGSVLVDRLRFGVQHPDVECQYTVLADNMLHAVQSCCSTARWRAHGRMPCQGARATEGCSLLHAPRVFASHCAQPAPHSRRVEAVRGFAARTAEGCFLLRTLAEHHLGRLAARCDEPTRGRLAGLKLRDWACGADGAAVAAQLISVLVTEHVAGSGAPSFDTLNRQEAGLCTAVHARAQGQAGRVCWV